MQAGGQRFEPVILHETKKEVLDMLGTQKLRNVSKAREIEREKSSESLGDEGRDKLR